jgi:MoaE-MoaD fusion protein
VSVRLTSRPLQLDAAYRALAGPGHGGVVVFAGRVRPDRVPRGEVRALLYEAHERPAIAALEAIERRAHRRVPGSRIVLWHRTGLLGVGVASVIVGAATPHRSDAFGLARWMIERLKVEAPIWKTDRVRPARRRRAPPGRRRAR